MMQKSRLKLDRDGEEKQRTSAFFLISWLKHLIPNLNGIWYIVKKRILRKNMVIRGGVDTYESTSY